MCFFLVLYVNHVECCNQIQGAAWRSGLHLTRYVEVVGSSPIKGPHSFFEQETLPLCLVLIGSRNGFERDFTIELK